MRKCSLRCCGCDRLRFLSSDWIVVAACTASMVLETTRREERMTRVDVAKLAATVKVHGVRDDYLVGWTHPEIVLDHWLERVVGRHERGTVPGHGTDPASERRVGPVLQRQVRAELLETMHRGHQRRPETTSLRTSRQSPASESVGVHDFPG